MTLLGFIVLVAVCGVLLWALTQFPAIDPTMAKIIRIVIICVIAIAAIVFIAGLLGYHGEALHLQR